MSDAGIFLTVAFGFCVGAWLAYWDIGRGAKKRKAERETVAAKLYAEHHKEPVTAECVECRQKQDIARWLESGPICLYCFNELTN